MKQVRRRIQQISGPRLFLPQTFVDVLTTGFAAATALRSSLQLVTMAALMESNSLPGKILCSAESYRLWLASKEDDKGEFLVEERGAIEVKGKGGGTMMTYWIGCGPDRLESC